MLLIRNAAQLLTVTTGRERLLSGRAMRQSAMIPDGAVVIRERQIEWIGPTSQLPPVSPDAQVIDATGKTVLPGLIDSHTHLVFAGSRENEFEQRLQGRTYQEIAAGGGGINATVRRVRQASRAELKVLARPRLERMLRFGVTTVEVKSGYGDRKSVV